MVTSPGYVLFVLEVPRPIRAPAGTTTNPDGRWTTQRIRNLVTELGKSINSNMTALYQQLAAFAAPARSRHGLGQIQSLML